MALTIPRKRVLVCAYACEPGQGSEPGVGWGVVCGLAHYHDLLVVTRTNNREKIEAATLPPGANVRFVYYDFPRWVQWLKRGPGGVYWYYSLWQWGAARWLKRTALSEFAADVAHHASFAMCWLPSLVSRTALPYVFGPVGGGERASPAAMAYLSWCARATEWWRVMAQNVCVRLPATRRTLRAAAVILASTNETSSWLARLGYSQVRLFSPGWITEQELAAAQSQRPVVSGFVFITVGRLLPWKGVALGLRAFARALPQLEHAEYWIAGAGPQRRELVRLADQLAILQHVRWLGVRPREETLATLAHCHTLIHPSMHDSASWVCLEALGLGKPVVCLRAGVAPHQVTNDCGFLIDETEPEAMLAEMARAMVALATRRDDYESKSRAARARFRAMLCAEANVPHLAQMLAQVGGGGRR